jgi:RimJ/RimL family protein N-acetyltransferase
MIDLSKNNNYWQGERVRLRAIEPGDWEVFFDWNSDTEVARECYYIPFPQSRESVKKWAAEKATEALKDDSFHFVIESLSGEIVGTINTHTCYRRNGTFMYGLAIRREHWRKGFASEAIQLVLKYFFKELGYQKVTAQVYAFNEASMSLHEKLGFHQEGCLRRMIYTDGVYYDEIIYGLTCEEFKEITNLKLNYSQL